MSNNTKSRLLSSSAALLFVLSNSQALAAGKITALNVNGDDAVFTTEEAKAHTKLPCVTGDENAWAVSTTATDGLYPLLTLAQQMDQPVEVTQGSTCLSGIEKPENIHLSYQAVGGNDPIVSSELSFVARSQIILAEGVAATVTFTLSGGPIEVTEKPGIESEGFYSAEFGLLSAGKLQPDH